MRISLDHLLSTGRTLLADGATGTNYMTMGLGPGEPPELWNVEHPERVTELHQRFADAGADIILTNTFGCNRRRLALHHHQHRVHELAAAGARLAATVAHDAPRSVVVAGSVGPTGDLFEPLGVLTHDEAVAVFREEIDGLLDGGADVVWIETMSAPEEMRAAAQAAVEAGAPYVVTASFDTAGRTMMGLRPAELVAVLDHHTPPPLATGANCGVGASDLLVTILAMDTSRPVVAKGNCGIPRFQGTEVVYTGTPALMGRYARLAADAGARIVGGCCGTSPDHLRVMRETLDRYVPGPRPTAEQVVDELGPLTNTPSDNADRARGADTRTGRRRSR